MSTYYIVWNETRTEGYVTSDIKDAKWTARGYGGGFGVPTVGEAFREAYADDDDGDDDVELVMECVTITPVEPAHDR